MKLLNKALASAMIIGAMFMANGCSTMEAVTGKDFASLDREFASIEPSLSKKSKPDFRKHKAYIAFNGIGVEYRVDSPSAIFEVVDGKVVLAGLFTERPGRVVLEVTPGEHTYIKKSRCGLYSVTVDAKSGYVYQLEARGLGSPALMSWCKNQGSFRMDNKISYKYQGIYQNFTLTEGTEKAAAEAVADAGLQEMYEEFIANKEPIDPRIKLYVSAEEGEKIE